MLHKAATKSHHSQAGIQCSLVNCPFQNKTAFIDFIEIINIKTERGVGNGT
jgi:hypothetical protein